MASQNYSLLQHKKKRKLIQKLTYQELNPFNYSQSYYFTVYIYTIKQKIPLTPQETNQNNEEDPPKKQQP